jgi:nucleotidyltransferase/DNA polymerase involved in DNA repair
MYGIIDCDNCYVSCERVFRPDLNGKPVVVLSNNDGCVVARSNEAKAMGIKAGTPYFQLAEQFQKMKRLDEVVDRINRLHGSETIVLGSQQYTQKNGKGKAEVFANAIKHDFRSPSPTTRWSEVIRLNSNAKKKDDKNDSGDK